MHTFADALKGWRQARRLSQLSLATEADVSARHISFLETGRARPSSAMIGRLCDVLDLPLGARNRLLTLAGFAAGYSGLRWDAEAMAPIREAVDYMLDRHAPYPAFAMDRMWRVLRLNRPAATLLGMAGIAEGSSMIDLFTSDTAPAIIENWPEVAAHLAHRLRTESVAQGGVTELDAAAAQMAQWQCAGPPPSSLVVPTVFSAGGLRLSLITTIATFGTPMDVTVDDLRIELMFPADADSTAVLLAMAGLTR